MVVVVVDEPSIAGIEPVVEQAVVVGNQVGVIVYGEIFWQYQFHVVEQISACLTCGRHTAIAVIDLQQGIGSEVGTYRPPDTEVFDGDIGGLDGGAVTQIHDLVAVSTAIKHQRRTMEVAPVVKASALRKYHFLVNIQIIAILQREVVTTDLLQPSISSVDQHTLRTSLGDTSHRGRRISLAAKDMAVVKTTTVQTDLIGANDAGIIAKSTFTRVILQCAFTRNLSTWENIYLPRSTTGRRCGTERHTLRDNHLASTTDNDDIAIGHTLVKAKRPSASHIDRHIATNTH